MKKLLIPIIIIGALVFIGMNAYNGMVTSRNEAEKKWSDLESAYQQRFEMIPNLVSIVKGYANHEKETLEAVVNARAKATQTKIDLANATPEQIAQYQQAQQGLNSALGRLLVTVEKYPDLHANQNFLELQSQYEGSENRVNVARLKFNKEATKYRNRVEKFPNNIFAGIFGFKALPLFKSVDGSEVSPEIQI